MLKIQKEILNEGVSVLKLEGDLTIEHVEELHQAINQELQASQHLKVDCERVTSVDVFCLQLFCSAHRSARAWGKEFSLQGKPSAAIKSATEINGFLRKNGCSYCPDDACILGCL